MLIEEEGDMLSAEGEEGASSKDALQLSKHRTRRILR
jgi:hypothetical protein